jgi:hypothetical protein
MLGAYPMPDEDTIETVLLQAAGERRPSSTDISPILALIEEGYDLDRDILPVIVRKSSSAKQKISSWRWFVASIREGRLRSVVGGKEAEDIGNHSTITGDFADGERPVHWITADDPRYGSLAARWATEKKQRRPAPIVSKWFKGVGWAFPAHWIV